MFQKIDSYIDFQNQKNQISNNVDEYSIKLSELNCLWIIMKNITLGTADALKFKAEERKINEIQLDLSNLRNKISQVEADEKNSENMAKNHVMECVPKIEEKITELYWKVERLINSDAHSTSIVVQELQ